MLFNNFYETNITNDFSGLHKNMNFAFPLRTYFFFHFLFHLFVFLPYLSILILEE